jgi:hypothetical protein
LFAKNIGGNVNGGGEVERFVDGSISSIDDVVEVWQNEHPVDIEIDHQTAEIAELGIRGDDEGRLAVRASSDDGVPSQL